MRHVFIFIAFCTFFFFPHNYTLCSPFCFLLKIFLAFLLYLIFHCLALDIPPFLISYIKFLYLLGPSYSKDIKMLLPSSVKPQLQPSWLSFSLISHFIHPPSPPPSSPVPIDSKLQLGEASSSSSSLVNSPS